MLNAWVGLGADVAVASSEWGMGAEQHQGEVERGACGVQGLLYVASAAVEIALVTCVANAVAAVDAAVPSDEAILPENEGVPAGVACQKGQAAKREAGLPVELAAQAVRHCARRSDFEQQIEFDLGGWACACKAANFAKCVHQADNSKHGNSP